MNVLGHDYEFAQFNIWILPGQIKPGTSDDLPIPVHLHLPFEHLPKYRQASLRDNGNEIRARLAIIVTLQTDRPAAVNLRIEIYGCLYGTRPNFLPTWAKASKPLSRSSLEWEADIITRIRALPCGTVG